MNKKTLSRIPIMTPKNRHTVALIGYLEMNFKKETTVDEVIEHLLSELKD